MPLRKQSDLSNSCRSVVSFTLRPLYLQRRRKIPRYPLNKRLGGPHSRCGQFGEGYVAPLLRNLTLMSLMPSPSPAGYTESAAKQSFINIGLIMIYDLRHAILMTQFNENTKQRSYWVFFRGHLNLKT
jgi:hypothetical protein